MFEDSWKPVSLEVQAKLCACANNYYPVGLLDPTSTVVGVRSLPFFRHHSLCRLTSSASTPHMTVYALCDLSAPNTNFHLLNGDEESVWEVSEIDPLFLGRETLEAYLEFYFRFVYPPEKKFFFIRSAGDISGLSETPKSFRRALEIMIKPPVIKEKEEEGGGGYVRTFLVWEPFLYQVNLDVTLTGKVAILDEKAVIDTVPQQKDWKI